MIIPMKKIAVMVQSKDADQSVGTLRKLGILHVEHQKPPKRENIVNIEEDIALVSKSLDILRNIESENSKGVEDKKETTDWRSDARHVVESHNRLARLEEYARTSKKSINQSMKYNFSIRLMSADK